MFKRRYDPSKVNIELFYEFARVILEDVESLRNEIERLKLRLERLEAKK